MKKVVTGKNKTLIIPEVKKESHPVIGKLSPGFLIKALPRRHGFVPNSQKYRDTVQANPEELTDRIWTDTRSAKGKATMTEPKKVFADYQKVLLTKTPCV